jgi:hypothetical protein
MYFVCLFESWFVCSLVVAPIQRRRDMVPTSPYPQAMWSRGPRPEALLSRLNVRLSVRLNECDARFTRHAAGLARAIFEEVSSLVYGPSIFGKSENGRL